MSKAFEFLEHTADVQFKAYGKTLNDVFRSCALALSTVLSPEKKITKKLSKKISVSGKDNEELLYRFIDELLFLLDAESFVVSDANVVVRKNSLSATVYGDDAHRYSGLDHVKAATYAEMYVKEVKKGKWEAQVVLDV